MNKITTLLIINLLLLLSLDITAQSIRRSVIASIGASESVDGNRIRSTVGQPPNAGTIVTPDNYLRQGFQQPSSCVTAPKAAFAIDLQGQEICGGPYQFFYLDDPRDETTFHWDFGQGALPDTSVMQNPEDITYLSTGFKTVTLTVTTGECVNTAVLNIDVQHTPLRTEIAKMDVLCLEDGDGSINLFVDGGTAPYDIQWNTGQSGELLTDLFPGDYAYTITDANNCTYEGEEEVIGPADSLQIQAVVIDESCHGNADGSIEVEAFGGTGPYYYNWTGGITGQERNDLNAGIYMLMVADENNCIRVEPIVVQVACESLEFYEVITPNGDGINDNWAIEGLNDFPQNELMIYDRWGRVVYDTKAYNSDWQGTRNDGSQLPFGAYYFVLKLNDPGNATYSGSISIVR